jgi:hypothetical protein
MAKGNDSVAAKLAAERGYVTQAQIVDALEIQRQAHQRMGMDHSQDRAD